MDIKTNGHLSDEITLTEDDLKKLSDGKELKGSGVVVKKEEIVTYSIGDRFKTKYEKVILVQVWTGEANLSKYALVRLSNGECWNGYFAVANPRKITAEEIDDTLGCLTRYWDARKKCEC